MHIRFLRIFWAPLCLNVFFLYAPTYGKGISPEGVRFLLIKGNNIQIEMHGGSSEIMIEGASYTQKKTHIAIEEDSAQKVQAKIRLPQDVGIILSGGEVNAQIQNMNSRLSIEMGKGKIQVNNSSFKRIKIMAAAADIRIEGANQETLVQMASGALWMHCKVPAMAVGLTLQRPPVVRFHTVSARATFVLDPGVTYFCAPKPKDAGVHLGSYQKAQIRFYLLAPSKLLDTDIKFEQPSLGQAAMSSYGITPTSH